MKKFACLMGLLLLVSVTAKAQDSSKAEVFGGYSYLRFNPGHGDESINFNGGIGSFAYNLTNMFAVEGEFAGYHGSNVFGSSASATTVSYLFGPKVSKSFGKITPFAHVLFGGAHASASGEEGGNFSSNAFALAVGGGVDYNVNSRFAIRFGELDYVYTRFIEINTGNQANFRYSGGVVIKF
jgi:opacity protein-like surface antigen